MAKDTGISWTNHTFNPWWGCTKVGHSPACDGCYAERLSERFGFKIWGNEAPRRYFGDKHWNEPLKWNRAAEHAKQRKRVFCMSMGDWAEGRPEQRDHLERLWRLIPRTPWLDWLMLTKRPQLIPALYPASWQCDALPNVWLGTTAETQAWLDLRWPLLKRAPAAVYWLSIEPLLEPITLPEDFLALGRQAWCIVGGESGLQARPMSPDWARHLRDQCMAAGVPFHFKQWGEWSATPARSGRLVQIDTQLMLRVGRKTAGRVLDGREWDEVPTPVREGPLDSKESAVALLDANRVEPKAAGGGQ